MGLIKIFKICVFRKIRRIQSLNPSNLFGCLAWFFKPMKMHVVKYLDEILVITSGSNLSKKKKKNIKVEDVDHGL